MKISKFILGSVLLGGMLTSCSDDYYGCIDGSGDEKTMLVSVSSFSNIELELDAQVYLSQGPREVKIVASDNLLGYIDTEVEGDDLVLELDDVDCISEVGAIKIYITNPDFEELNISGSGSIFNKTALNLNDLEINIEGSGDVKLDDLTIDDLDLRVSGSGDVNLSGTGADDAEITILGSGDVDLSGLPIKDASVKVKGSGDAELDVSNTLDASISGSGDITYSGTPTVTKNITGSGVVKNN